MRYLDYLIGQPVSFTIAERVSPQQVAERLRSEVRSRFWPFHFEKVVGRVGAETLSIEWRGGAFGSAMAAPLSGRLTSTAGGTQFRGRFGAPLAMRLFLVVWTCFDFMAVVLMLGGGSRGQAVPWFVFPFLLVHWLAPFGMVALGLIGADIVKQRLIDFVIDVGAGRNFQQRERSSRVRA